MGNKERMKALILKQIILRERKIEKVSSKRKLELYTRKELRDELTQKNRSPRLSKESLDFHLYNRNFGLMGRGIVKSIDGKLELNIKDFDSLVEIVSILFDDEALGTKIERAVKTAFLKCFLSVFGDRLNMNHYITGFINKHLTESDKEMMKIHVEFSGDKSMYNFHDWWRVIDHTHENAFMPYLFLNLEEEQMKGLWNDNVVSKLMEFVYEMRDKIGLAEMIAYTTHVMGIISFVITDYRHRDKTVYEFQRTLNNYTIAYYPIRDIIDQVNNEDAIYYLHAYFDLIIGEILDGSDYYFEVYGNFEDSSNVSPNNSNDEELDYQRLLKDLKSNRTGVKGTIDLFELLAEIQMFGSYLDPFRNLEDEKKLLANLRDQIQNHLKYSQLSSNLK